MCALGDDAACGDHYLSGTYGSGHVAKPALALSGNSSEASDEDADAGTRPSHRLLQGTSEQRKVYYNEVLGIVRQEGSALPLTPRTAGKEEAPHQACPRPGVLVRLPRQALSYIAECGMHRGRAHRGFTLPTGPVRFITELTPVCLPRPALPWPCPGLCRHRGICPADCLQPPGRNWAFARPAPGRGLGRAVRPRNGPLWRLHLQPHPEHQHVQHTDQ